MVPYDMSSNWCYECPITGKKFEFSRDKASKKEAFSAQQLHTASHIQRLEQAAGRTMSFRELTEAGRLERQQAAAAAKEAEKQAAEEATAKPEEAKPDPFVEQIFQSVTPYMS